MRQTESFLPQDIYDKHLSVINGVNFTRREIDVISCLLSMRGTSRVAGMLDIAPRTVTTHIHNVMLKLDCNARDGIIDFIQKSGKLSLIRAHYANLLIQEEFQKSLREISRLKREEAGCTVILYWYDHDSKNTLISHLNTCFTQAGLRVEIIDQRKKKTELENLKPSTSLRVVLVEESPHEISESLKTFDSVDENDQKNFHFLVFKILEKLLSNTNLSVITSGFKEKFETIERTGLSTEAKNLSEKDTTEKGVFFKFGNHIWRNKKWQASALLGFLISGGMFSVFQPPQLQNTSHEEKDTSIRSDLILPAESILLHRPEIMDKIDSKLKGKTGVQTVVLVGIGGSGKTTLARQYAHQQKFGVIWEINAETRDSLVNSFKSLAYELAKTKEQKNELLFVQQIQDPEEQKRRILSMVKGWLNQYQNWLLIYDNVESFPDIKTYFPYDSHQWGNGNVIITTQDDNIQHTSYINPENVLHVEALSSKESAILFYNIRYNNGQFKFPTEHLKKEDFLLKKIPPFPLDVSAAAHYINSTGISYEEYLKEIEQQSKSFEVLQESIVNEVTHYSKTRYGIISLSFRKLIEINPAFKDLLFMMCLIDSQNIPIELFYYYKGKINSDLFLRQLKKYSLISISSNIEKGRKAHTFSLHRSTQNQGMMFLLNLLNCEEKQSLLNGVISTIKSFYAENVEKNQSIMICLIPHLESLIMKLNSIELHEEFKKNFILNIKAINGTLYYFSRNFISAEKYLSDVYSLQKSNAVISNKIWANMLKILCDILIYLEKYDQAIMCAKKSIQIYKKEKNSEILIGENILYIGYANMYNNNFVSARYYFDSLLNHISILPFEKKKDLLSETYRALAELYSLNYLNSIRAQKSEEYIKKAISIQDSSEVFQKNPQNLKKKISCLVAITRVTSGQIYCQLGKYTEAVNEGFGVAQYIISNSLDDCSHNLLDIQISLGLGEVLLREQNEGLANEKLTNALQKTEELLGKNNTWLILPIKVFRAEALIRLGKFQEAYEDCISVFNMEKKPQTNYFKLMDAVNIYHMAIITYKQGDLEKSIALFSHFLNEINIFCREFLDEKTYNDLEAKGVFKKNNLQKENYNYKILHYLKNSLIIFSEIYGKSHPFVKYYVENNIKYIASPVLK